jgi:MtaA/CmuA family methyltransferase
MRAVLSGVLPDRVPFAPTIYVDNACLASGRKFEDALVNPALGQQCMLEAARRYKSDTVRFCLGPDASWYEKKAVVERDGRLVEVSRKSGNADGYYDVEGGGKLIPFQKKEAVRTIHDVRDIGVPSATDYLERGCLKDVMTYAQAAHDDGLFVIGMCSGQTLNFLDQQMGGIEAALLLLMDDPALASALIDKGVAISIEKGKAFIEAGVDCLYIGDSSASCSVISPETYGQFCAPAYTQVAQEFHREDVFCYMHCCGNYNPLLERLPSIGIDGMDGIDPESGMSVRQTKERIGTELTLMGGISCMTLLNGEPENVYDEAKRCTLAGKAGGRYVLGSACAVPRYTPPENMMAARQAAVDHGSYYENTPEENSL